MWKQQRLSMAQWQALCGCFGALVFTWRALVLRYLAVLFSMSKKRRLPMSLWEGFCRDFEALVLAFLALVLCSLVVAVTHAATPGKLDGTVSELEMARTVSNSLESRQQQQAELISKLNGAVDRYSASVGNLGGPAETLQVFLTYTETCLQSARELAQLHKGLTTTNQEIRALLRKAPQYYLEAGRANRSRMKKATFAEVKAQYLLAAEMWEALAARALEDAKTLDLAGAQDGFLAFLEEQVTFLENFRNDLRAMPLSSARAEMKKLLERTAEQARMIDALKAAIKTVTEKARSVPAPSPDNSPAPVVRESK